MFDFLDGLKFYSNQHSNWSSDCSTNRCNGMHSFSSSESKMNLTRKQITIVVSSLLLSQKQFYEDSEMYKDMDELIELFDLEHQKIVRNEK